jgi:uncharacterized cupredoxin-like copper-binding protein
MVSIVSRRTWLAVAVAGALLISGCRATPGPPPVGAPPSVPTTPVTAPQHPELVKPFDQALLALKSMNAAGKQTDAAAAKAQFDEYRKHWAVIRVQLAELNAALAQNLEDGAAELDHEFTKPADQVRGWELEEETIKLGRLLANAADQLHVPINADLVQKVPTQNAPFTKEVKVAVTLSEHKIQPAVITLDQHTKVTFVITNAGKEVHEFEVGHYAVAVADLKPGETREVTLVLLDAGEFETACHVPGHYEVGMHGTLVVNQR